MGLGHSPRIVTDGLVLCLDAANRRSLTGESLGTLIESISVSSVTGSGPSYTVTYSSTPTGAQTNDKVIVEKRDAGAGGASAVLSIYTYTVTATNLGSNQLTIQYSSDTAGLGDDSPNDLYSGEGSSGSPEIAPHKILRPDSWLDVSKGGNDGFMTNMDYATNFSSANGGSLSFDGTNEYIDLGTITSGSVMSLSVWVNLDVNNIYQHIIDSSSNYWHFAMLNTGYVYFYNGSVYPGSQSQISANTWYMLSLSFDLTSWRIYINGALDKTLNYTTSALNHGNINIGRWQSGGRYLNGKISNLQIYNRTLSADEIRQNYLATKERYA